MEIAKLAKWIKANWLLSIGLAVVFGFAYFAIGCVPETKSLINPDEKVTRSELKCEIDYLLLKSESRIADLNRQEEIRKMIFDQSVLLAQTGNINPTGVVTTLLALLGIFSTADDVRLRKKIKKLPLDK